MRALKVFALTAILAVAAGCASTAKVVAKDLSLQDQSSQATNRFGVILYDNDFSPAVFCGHNYVLVPLDMVWDGENGIVKKFVIAYGNEKDPNAQIVARYNGMALLHTSINVDFKAIELAPPVKVGDDVLFLQPIVVENGNKVEVSLLSIWTKVADIKDDFFTVSSPFYAGYEGTGVFNLRGQLVGVGAGNYAVSFGDKSSVSTYGRVLSSKSFEQFFQVINGIK